MPIPTIDSKLAAIKHLAVDMDGTIYKGARLFDFTRPFLALMQDLRIGVTFLTNNSSRSAVDYIRHLEAWNLSVRLEQIYTAGMATIDYLQTHHPNYQRLFILGTRSLREEFVRAGFSECCNSDAAEPDAVVVGFDSELVFDRLGTAGYWIDRGKPFIATHPDVVCPTDQKIVQVDCGALCACLTAATGRSPDLVLGKPHPVMLDGLLRRHQLDPSQLAMIGDRLSTDMAMAKVAHAVGILVLTGEASAGDADNCPVPPDYVMADLAEVGRRLQRVMAADNP